MAEPFVPTTDKSVSGGVGVFDTGNVSEKEYTTQGNTVVRTPHGYRFAPTENGLPVIHSGGVKVTKNQALALVKESDGLVIIDAKEGDEPDDDEFDDTDPEGDSA